MDATRLISLAVFVVASVGLAIVGRGDSWPLTVAGAFLMVGSAMVFFRHFWRESDRKRKQDLAAITRSFGTAGADTQQALQEGLASVSHRVDGFSKGILEYVTQLEMDVAALQKRWEKSDRDALRHRDDILTQVSGVMGVYATLKPEVPYPTFGGWAIGGDCAQRLVALIMSTRPTSVIEVGSGLSTILIARALELVGGEGRVVSLEHEKRWLEETSALIASHGVEHRVTLVHAPLVETAIGNESFPWYDLTGVELPERAQLIFVDGPPKATGPLARYPALPMLHGRIDEGGTLLMDDATRPDERAAVDRWAAEFPDLAIRFHSDSKGTVEIVKGGS
jgi:predicted O-methyltransferase YrrM